MLVPCLIYASLATFMQASPQNKISMPWGYKLMVYCAYESGVSCHLYHYVCGIAGGIAVWNPTAYYIDCLDLAV